jgi:hypothetical protein
MKLRTVTIFMIYNSLNKPQMFYAAVFIDDCKVFGNGVKSNVGKWRANVF